MKLIRKKQKVNTNKSRQNTLFKESEFLAAVLDIVFPRRCAICDNVLSLGERNLCRACKEKMQFLGSHLCLRCGKEVKEEEEYCYDCRRKSHVYDQGRAVFSYEYIQPSLYRFKYAGRKEYAGFYAKSIAGKLQEICMQWKPQALVPVPLHPNKRKKRGYNQAEEIAIELGKIWKLPVLTDLVVRCKNTRPMKEIVGTDRQNNLKKAFKLGQNRVKLKTIIIIDDIYTTGSTIDAVAEVCRDAEIEDIYFITVSIGNGL